MPADFDFPGIPFQVGQELGKVAAGCGFEFHGARFEKDFLVEDESQGFVFFDDVHVFVQFVFHGYFAEHIEIEVVFFHGGFKFADVRALGRADGRASSRKKTEGTDEGIERLFLTGVVQDGHAEQQHEKGEQERTQVAIGRKPAFRRRAFVAAGFVFSR